MGSDQIRELLEQGLNNRAIARRTGVGERRVARARTDAGLPPATRSSWERAPHPKTLTIRLLLDEGHTDKAISERTGADVGTVARMRREGGFGRATITRVGKRRHPKEAAIRELLGAGWSNDAIARELHADRAAIRRIRSVAKIPNVPQQPLTLEGKWAAKTAPVDGGHLDWTGSRSGTGGTPLLVYRGKSYTAAAVAFRKRTGRQGHDQAQHGRYSPDGVAYCQACHDREA